MIGWTLGVPPTAFLVCSAVGIAASILACLGGYFCLKRQKYGLCNLASVMAIVSGIAGIGALLALLALVLVNVGRDDFLDQLPRPRWIPNPWSR